jgi:2-haloacid dehalogenase
MEISVVAFDAYGTLFDVHSPVRNHLAQLGPTAEGFSQLWRTKQLEYTWLRSLMQSHADFWQVTREALEYASDVYGFSDLKLQQALLGAYLRLECYADVKDTLGALRLRGIRCAILSNGTPEMLAAAVESAGLAGDIESVLSVEEVHIFKPAPAVYQLIEERLGAKREEVCFVSSNCWDAIGAGRFGLRVVWVNRTRQKRERLPFEVEYEIRTLAELPGFLDMGGAYKPGRG